MLTRPFYCEVLSDYDKIIKILFTITMLFFTRSGGSYYKF